MLLFVSSMYFSSSRIDELMTKTFLADDFYLVQGKIQKQNNNTAFQINADTSGASSIIIKRIAVESEWYDRIEVVFSQKPSLQSLVLRVKSINEKSREVVVRDVPILYTDNLVSRFSLDNLVNTGDVITSIELSTPKLVSPYQLSSIKIIAKEYDFFSASSILIHDAFSSVNILGEQSFLLVPSKLLLVLFFGVVTVIFLLMMVIAKRTLALVWLWVLIVLWLILDARFIYGDMHNNSMINSTAAPTTQLSSIVRDTRIKNKHVSEVS